MANEYTRSKLRDMEASRASPPNLDRDLDAETDRYGRKAARSSDSSACYRQGGAVRKMNAGRVGRANGGSIAGQLIRTQKTPREKIDDDRKDWFPLADRPLADIQDAKGQARLRRSDGRVTPAVADEPARNAFGRGKASDNPLPGSGRSAFARGGRTKGKTVVNVVIAGDRGQQQPQQAAPPPMPPPMPVTPPPAPPPRPPMGMPGMPPGAMPIGGAPMGAAGAPPPGVPPTMRARGGRISNKSNIPGHGGTRGQVTVSRKFGAGSGNGRLEKARAEGARLPRPEKDVVPPRGPRPKPRLPKLQGGCV